MKTAAATFLALLCSLAAASCAGTDADDDGRCAGGKCDDLDKPDSEVEDTPCDGILLDFSGRGHSKVAGRLHDPLATLAFRGESCPTTYQDIMAKLRETDSDGCDPSDPRAGIQTRVVSETAQILDKPTDYRLVTTRQCGDRPTHGLLFSLFGVGADATALPENVEIIAFDEAAGVFNFYEAERGGTLKFFGNSKDMLKGDAPGQIRRCAKCHPAGGLVMKELDTPWLHWEGHTDTPGASELVERFDDLGTKTDGREFERVVLAANGAWNETRAKHMMETQSTREVLRPLFCTVEVNLDTGADFASPASGATEDSFMRLLPGPSMLSPLLNPGDSLSFPPTPSGIPFEPTDYERIIKANGQRVPGIPGAVDTLFDYPFVTVGAIDNHYRTKLLVAGVVDDKLVKDIFMVDFTRPVFSEDRCGLLEFVPNLPADQLTATNVRDGLIQNLLGAAPGSPAAELLANLTNTETDHLETVAAFVDICEARFGEKHVLHEGTPEEVTVSAGLFDVIALNSLNRRLARELDVFEFAQTMPTDNLNLPAGSRLDPTDCTITTEFVAIGVAGEIPDPEPEPDATCAHDICEDDVALDPSCDDCVAQICAVDSFCCGTAWDSLCVDQVESVCGQTCE